MASQARLPGVSLDADLWSRFREVADTLGTTRSELIRDLITNAVGDEATQLAIASNRAAVRAARVQLDRDAAQLAIDRRALRRTQRELDERSRALERHALTARRKLDVGFAELAGARKALHAALEALSVLEGVTVPDDIPTAQTAA